MNKYGTERAHVTPYKYFVYIYDIIIYNKILIQIKIKLACHRPLVEIVVVEMPYLNNCSTNFSRVWYRILS